MFAFDHMVEYYRWQLLTCPLRDLERYQNACTWFYHYLALVEA